MQIISIDKFVEILEKDNLRLVVTNNKNLEIEVSQNVEYSFNFDKPSANVTEIDKGYIIIYEEEEKEIETIKDVLIVLEEKECFMEEKIKVLSFDNFKTYEKYLEDKAFSNISMQELLKKYENADRFSLTTPYCRYSSVTKPFGDIKVDEITAIKAIKKLEDHTINNLKTAFRKIEEEIKNISFDELISNINTEIDNYRKKKKMHLKKNGGESFICDQFRKGKTNYKEPQDLRHFYHRLEMIKSFEWIMKKLEKNKKERPLDEELYENKYAVLKNNLIETEVTFVWHCTVSSQLSKVFYFKLNDETKSWLSQFENDYEVDFEDLAFYKGKEVLFSSCTHENFHNDLTEKGD